MDAVNSIRSNTVGGRMAGPAVLRRWLEPAGNGRSRYMVVFNRTRLTGPLTQNSQRIGSVGCFVLLFYLFMAAIWFFRSPRSTSSGMILFSDSYTRLEMYLNPSSVSMTVSSWVKAQSVP